MEYRFDPELRAGRDLPDARFDDVPLARSAMATLVHTPDAPEDIHVEDFTIPTSAGRVDARRYRSLDRGDEPLPAYTHIHGGGFALGDLAVAHGKCIELARSLPIAVIQVDYRLAPEHPFPAALFDCMDAWRWIHGNADDLRLRPDQIVLGGDSAGGCLAVATTLRLRELRAPTPAALMLAAPVLDSRLQTTSMRRFDATPVWSRHSSRQSWELYLADGVEVDGRRRPDLAAPALATKLAGLPPTFVAACEYDPLRDEAIEFAQSLLRAGVNTDLHVFAGTYHGFWTDPSTSISRRWLGEQIGFLQRRLLGRPRDT